MGRREYDRDEQALFSKGCFPFLFALYTHTDTHTHTHTHTYLIYLAAMGLVGASGI